MLPEKLTTINSLPNLVVDIISIIPQQVVIARVECMSKAIIVPVLG